MFSHVTNPPKLSYANSRNMSRSVNKQKQQQNPSQENISGIFEGGSSTDIFSHLNQDNLKYIKKQLKNKKSNSLSGAHERSKSTSLGPKTALANIDSKAEEKVIKMKSECIDDGHNQQSYKKSEKKAHHAQTTPDRALQLNKSFEALERDKHKSKNQKKSDMFQGIRAENNQQANVELSDSEQNLSAEYGSDQGSKKAQKLVSSNEADDVSSQSIKRSRRVSFVSAQDHFIQLQSPNSQNLLNSNQIPNRNSPFLNFLHEYLEQLNEDQNISIENGFALENNSHSERELPQRSLEQSGKVSSPYTKNSKRFHRNSQNSFPSEFDIEDFRLQSNSRSNQLFKKRQNRKNNGSSILYAQHQNKIKADSLERKNKTFSRDGNQQSHLKNWISGEENEQKSNALFFTRGRIADQNGLKTLLNQKNSINNKKQGSAAYKQNNQLFGDSNRQYNDNSRAMVQYLQNLNLLPFDGNLNTEINQLKEDLETEKFHGMSLAAELEKAKQRQKKYIKEFKSMKTMMTLLMEETASMRNQIEQQKRTEQNLRQFIEENMMELTSNEYHPLHKLFPKQFQHSTPQNVSDMEWRYTFSPDFHNRQISKKNTSNYEKMTPGLPELDVYKSGNVYGLYDSIKNNFQKGKQYFYMKQKQQQQVTLKDENQVPTSRGQRYRRKSASNIQIGQKFGDFSLNSTFKAENRYRNMADQDFMPAVMRGDFKYQQDGNGLLSGKVLEGRGQTELERLKAEYMKFKVSVNNRE